MGGGQRWSRGELHGSVTRILRRRYGRTGELQQQTAFPDASVADDYVLEEIGIFVEHATGQEGTENEPLTAKACPWRQRTYSSCWVTSLETGGSQSRQADGARADDSNRLDARDT